MISKSATRGPTAFWSNWWQRGDDLDVAPAELFDDWPVEVVVEVQTDRHCLRGCRLDFAWLVRLVRLVRLAFLLLTEQRAHAPIELGMGRLRLGAEALHFLPDVVDLK